MTQEDFDDNGTQAMPDLQRSIEQLGPRTTTHGTGNMGAEPGADRTPKFDEWVARWVADHIPTAMEKAATYGSNSLAKKGQRFAAARGDGGVATKTALELGVAQYVAEKADRIEDAILRGQLPGNDTWVDVAIYALMAQYIRQTGSW